MKSRTLLILAYGLQPIACSLAQIAQISWDVQQDRPVAHDVYVWQGETVDLLPRLVQGIRPVAITNAPVEFRYREASLPTNTYRYVAAAANTNNGVVAVRWIPEYDAGAAWYDYQIVVGSNAANPRCFGRIAMRPTIGWNASTNPPPPVALYPTRAELQTASNALASALQVAVTLTVPTQIASATGDLARVTLQAANTNGWETGPHRAWLTNESDIVALEALRTNRVTRLQNESGTRWTDATGGVWQVSTVTNYGWHVFFYPNMWWSGGLPLPSSPQPYPFTNGIWSCVYSNGKYELRADATPVWHYHPATGETNDFPAQLHAVSSLSAGGYPDIRWTNTIWIATSVVDRVVTGSQLTQATNGLMGALAMTNIVRSLAVTNGQTGVTFGTVSAMLNTTNKIASTKASNDEQTLWDIKRFGGVTMFKWVVSAFDEPYLYLQNDSGQNLVKIYRDAGHLEIKGSLISSSVAPDVLYLGRPFDTLALSRILCTDTYGSCYELQVQPEGTSDWLGVMKWNRANTYLDVIPKATFSNDVSVAGTFSIGPLIAGKQAHFISNGTNLWFVNVNSVTNALTAN